MSVLTGAAAAALYGSEAANGAVMITTKKGQAGALKVTLSSNTEFLNPFVLPEFQNRYGTGLNGTRSGSGIYSWGEKLLPAARYGYTPNDYFETGHVYTNAVTVSGGTDKNQTYFRQLRSTRTESSPTTSTTVTISRSATLRTF